MQFKCCSIGFILQRQRCFHGCEKKNSFTRCRYFCWSIDQPKAIKAALTNITSEDVWGCWTRRSDL